MTTELYSQSRQHKTKLTSFKEFKIKIFSNIKSHGLRLEFCDYKNNSSSILLF